MKKILLAGCIMAITLTGCIKKDFSTANSNLQTNNNANNFNVSANNNTNSNFNGFQKDPAPTDFSRVCNGETIDKAAAYDKSTGAISPVSIYFRPNADPNVQPYFRDADSVHLSNLSDDWQLKFSAPEKTQLVACMTLKELKEKKKCSYKDDDNGKTYQMAKYIAKYNFKIYEARTGNIVADKNFDVNPDNECSIIEFFSSEQETETPDQERVLASLASSLRPFVKH